MTIAITCPCSARLEVDEKFAGQQITCPDCQSALQVPHPVLGEAQRTSGFALASVVLGMVGAFTILGTVLGVACGIIALVQIRGNPGRLAGTNFAWAGIVLGVLLTGLSLFAYSSAEFFGIDPVLQQTLWLGKLDYPDPLEVRRTQDGFMIQRPSREWGVLKSPAGSDFDPWGFRTSDFLMVNPSKPAYVFVLQEMVDFNADIYSCKDRALQVFGGLEISGLTLRRGPPNSTTVTPEQTSYRHEKKTGLEMLEMTVDKKYGGQTTRTFLLRVYKRDNDNLMYIVAGGSEKVRFPAVREEIEQALNSFQLLDRPLPGLAPPGRRVPCATPLNPATPTVSFLPLSPFETFHPEGVRVCHAFAVVAFGTSLPSLPRESMPPNT